MSNKKETRKRGNKFGFWFFKVLTKFTGLSGAYGFLYIICLYYLIFDKNATEKAKKYIKRRFYNSSNIKCFFHVYLLFINQGKQLIDKYAYSTAPEIFNVHLKTSDEIINTFQDLQKGSILLTSHIGNWQLGISSFKFLENKRLNILKFPESNKSLEETLSLNDGRGKINFISSLEFLGGTIELYNYLKNNEIISIMGDRSYGSKTIKVNFLNDSANFPYSAFYLAALADCPIVILNVVKESKTTYYIYMNKTIYPKFKSKHLSKKEQLRPYIQEYIAELEKFINKYPYQCFLFDDIWNE